MSKGKKLTINEVRNFIDIDSNSGCKLISIDYINAHEKLEIMCKCGKIYLKNYNKFKSLAERRCNECAGKKDWNIETVREFIESESNCKLISKEFRNFKTLLTIECKCGRVFYVNFNKFKDAKQRQCPECGQKESIKNRTFSHADFLNKVLELVGNEYEVLTEYTRSRNHVIIKHVICNNTYHVKPNNFTNGHRCPYCNESKGEKKIREFLQSIDIKFEMQYCFENLKGIGGGLLRFDFAIFNKRELILLLEYDGEFHFKKQYSEDRFEVIKIHDNIKNTYCLDNNIRILRIPYWKLANSEEIIKEELKQLLTIKK